MAATGPSLDVTLEGAVVRLGLAGDWTLARGVPSVARVAREIGDAARRRVAFDARGLAEWDNALVTFAYEVAELAAEKGIDVDLGGLPIGAQKLLALARAVPARPRTRTPVDDALPARVGRVALRASGTAGDALDFLGETFLALVDGVRGRARFRRIDLLYAVEATGVEALGIVGLVNFLIGAVLAFVGAVELEQFGAAIYVASLVGIGV